jgi:hypothetical protein
VSGLTREALRTRLAEAGAPADFQARVARLQDACDEVRFAPGAARIDRATVLADAEALAGGWEGA